MKRRDFLIGATATALTPLLGRLSLAETAATPAFKNVFVVFAPGGWDVTYLFDPKPDNSAVTVPDGDITSVGNLDLWLSASRPNCRNFFEAHGALCAVVNGIQVRSIAHLPCRRRILTGRAATDAPDLCSILGHELGRDLPVGSLVLGNTSFPGTLAYSSVRVGTTNQLTAVLDPRSSYNRAPSLPHPTYNSSPAETALIRSYVQTRVERERAQRGRLGANRRMLDDFVHSLDRGQALRSFSEDFGQRGVTLDIVAQGNLAIRAARGGLTRVVLLEDRSPWDTHQSFDLQGLLFEQLFGGLHAFMDALQGTPGSTAGQTLLDESLVVVLSEMSRTPLLNAAGGKDHWPYTSALLINPNLRSGIYGATDDRLEGSPVDLATGSAAAGGTPLMAETLIATILQAAGANPDSWLPSVPTLQSVWT